MSKLRAIRKLRKLRVLIVLVICFGSATTTLARDTTLHLSISDAMNSSDFKAQINPEISFYFGEQSHPEVLFGKGEYVTNKKTNAFGKSDFAACEWVMLSAMLSLQQRAISEGGNAVVDIVSYYKKNEFSSETEFECHAGGIIAGVALKGRVVTLP